MEKPAFENLDKGVEKIKPNELSFDDLKKLSKEVAELSKNTFKRIEDGFVNVNGDPVTIIKRGGIYELLELSTNLRDIHRYVAVGPGEIIRDGHADKEVMMEAIEKMIIETGGRIIE